MVSKQPMNKNIVLSLLTVAVIASSTMLVVKYRENEGLRKDNKFNVDTTLSLLRERDNLSKELIKMTNEAHPYRLTGQVGPTASLELQCLQFKGLLPTPKSDDPEPK